VKLWRDLISELPPHCAHCGLLLAGHANEEVMLKRDVMERQCPMCETGKTPQELGLI